MSKNHEFEVPLENDSGSIPQEQATQQPAASPQPEAASLLQVREILLGPLASDLERRIASMDQRLDQTIQEFGRTSSERIDAVESIVQSELGRLGDELGNQRDRHNDRADRLQQELTQGLEQMRGRIQEVSESVDKTAESLRSEIAEQFEGIRGRLEELFAKVTGRLDEEKQRLREELVDRETLSAALSEVAIRLAPSTDRASHLDHEQPDAEIDQILEDATSGQF